MLLALEAEMRTERLVLALLALSTLGCMGGQTSSSPAGGPAIVEEAGMELTEPWKSMGLPVEGAVVKASTKGGFIIRYPTVSPDDAGLPYAALKEAFIKAGWTLEREQIRPPRWRSVLESSDGREGRLRMEVINGRPEGGLSMME